MLKENKQYDVILLTYAPSDDIIILLQKLLIQNILPTKIIICNTDEKLFYKNIVNKNELNELLNNDNIYLYHINKNDFDHGRTRNFGILKCSSPYFLMLTDDAIPYDEMLAINLLNAFDDEYIAVANARQIAKPNAKLKEKLVRNFNYPNFDILKNKSTEKIYGIKNYYCSNVCAMYNRKIFESLGKFEEDIILNEDTFYAYKAINNDYKIIYKSDAKVLHSHNFSYIEQFKRNFDIGVSQATKKEIFSKIEHSKQGINFVSAIMIELIKKFKIIAFVDFFIECIFRFLGYKFGKNYKKFPLSLCIKFASNKNYFLKK